MRQYRLNKTGSLDCLELFEVATPRPAHGEVLVRMNAASLNYRDLLTVRGAYGSWQKLPLVPLSDGAGVVAEVGSGVMHLKPGDRVTNAFLPNWISGEANEERLSGSYGGLVDGVLSEYCVFPQHALVETPDFLSDAMASTLPCAAVTAWSAVCKLGGLKPGATLLTQGSGGVSTFALQFGKLCGARVIATSSSDEKLARLRDMGADGLINYRTTPDWGKKARELTGGEGVDLVVEVGGSGTFNESIRATRSGGTIALIGVLASGGKEPRLPLVAMQQQRIQGIACGSVEDLTAVVRALSLHQVEPVVDRIFPFDAAREAFAYLESGKHFGKVVINIHG